MSNSLKHLFETPHRLLVVGTHPVLEGVELAGPPSLEPLRLSGNVRLVLQRLADHVNFSSNTSEARVGCWPSRSTLAAASMSPKTVDRAISELVRRGFITVTERFCGPGKNAASQLSNMVVFNPDLLAAAKGASKFTAAVAMGPNGLTWPAPRKTILKTSARASGFPFEYRCKPCQDSFSKGPLVNLTTEPLRTQPPLSKSARGLALALKKKKKSLASGCVSSRAGSASVVSTTEAEGSKASALVPC